MRRFLKLVTLFLSGGFIFSALGGFLFSVIGVGDWPSSAFFLVGFLLFVIFLLINTKNTNPRTRQ